jgi:serpin B
MRKVLALAVLGLAALPWGAAAQEVPLSPLARAQNAFAMDLYGRLGQTPGNLFFSPYSIATALDMVYVGAKGATADEMARTLHLNLLDGTDKRQALLNAGKAQLQDVNKPSGFTLQNANALWGDKGFTFNPGFIVDIQTSFGADLKPVNFKHPEQAAGQINQWVAEQTQNRIQNLVSADALQGDPAMVLTNAVYFESRWVRPFDAAATKPALFHVSAAHDVSAQMMNTQNFFTLTQTEGVKILSMAYGDYGTSMAIILPDAPQGLADVEARLSAAKLDDWLEGEDSLPGVPVILSLPKFRIGSAFALKPALQSLGMNAAFTPGQADFTGIAHDLTRPLYVGAVVHKAYIDVDEQGTEAAAATAVIMSASGGIEPPPPPPVRFNADHPFIYLIYSSQTGEILFMGRVDDPTQQGD